MGLMNFTLFLAALLAAPQQPSEKKRPDILVGGQTGWSARVVQGEPAPVILELDNIGKDREIRITLAWGFAGLHQDRVPTPDSLRGAAGPRYELNTSIGGGARKRIHTTVRTLEGDGLSLWAFVLGADGKFISSGELPTRAMDPKKRLVVFVSIAYPPGVDKVPFEIARVLPQYLPESAEAYAGVEALVWLDPDGRDLATDAQVAALKAWVSGGGHLVVARNADTGLTGTALMEFLPVSLLGSRPVDSLSGLGAEIKNPPSGGAALLGTRVKEGRARLMQGDIPLVVEAPRDGGRVTFASFDPTKEPFSSWPDMPSLWTWLIPVPAPLPSKDDAPSPPPLALGSHSLNRLAPRIPGVTPPSLTSLFVIIGVYVVVVGPLDYFLLRSFRRLEFTWFTFPAYVLGFTALILVMGGAFMSGSSYQRDLAVADHYPESGFWRRRALGALLSPVQDVFALKGAFPLSVNFLSSGRSDSDPVDRILIRRTPGPEAGNLFVNRNATALSLMDSSGRDPSPLSFTLKPAGENELLVTVRNASGAVCDHAMLLSAGGVYSLPEIPTGTSELRAKLAFSDAGGFARTEGASPDSGAPNERQRYNGEEPATQMKEQEESLNAEARRVLIGLSFSSTQRAPALTGLARDLDITRWADSGGSVLLAWPRSPDTLVGYSPRAGRRSAALLYRIFQRKTS